MMSMKKVFGQAGLLAAALPDYEYRPGQLAMADQVAGALENGEILLYEAPTGTGKTLAYLIPTLLADDKIVISTHTKALQEQILLKDLPLAERVLGVRIKTAVMKGRQNYLCRYRMRLFQAQPMFASMEESGFFDRIVQWAHTTETGDREELGDLPDEFPTWHEINSHTSYCRGQRCTNYPQCFFTKMRQRAMEADLVIVNHHLFFADLAVRDQGQGEVIPRYQALVLDEAHHIEDVATQFFGFKVSNYRIEELARDVSRALAAAKINDETVVARLRSLRDVSEVFFARFAKPYEESYALKGSFRYEDILPEHNRLTQVLSSLGEALANLHDADQPELLAPLEERSAQIAQEMDVILDLDDREYVHWCESRRGGVFLHASPIELKGAVSDLLFHSAPSMILCSATMTTQGDFTYFKNRIGLESEVVETVGEPYFDYSKQAVLYLPREFPEPNSPDFVDALAEQMERILLASGGRAFCLFTSYRNMNAVHAQLASRLPYTVLVQGQGAKTAILDRFRQDEHSVLFATASFWSGVDVIGSALSVVLIDKLPFASPGEPIVEARIDALRADQANPFRDYQLPQAIITLKQGLGRLIRHRDDRGVLGVFDVRMRSRPYGRTILASLPDFPVTSDLKSLEDTLRRLPKRSGKANAQQREERP